MGILRGMTTENSFPSPLPLDQWRKTFAIAINQRSGGATDSAPIADWAIQAHAQHGDRNPVEVAHEVWSGRPY